MDIFVSSEDANLLDDQFIDIYPKLGLKKTSNSGAFHGDGDGRPSAIDYEKTRWALESKARFSPRHKHCRPTSAEYVKACEQLRKFDRGALRLILVYNQNLGTYAVSIPEEDLERLDIDAGGQERYVRSGGSRLYYRHLPYLDWLTFYERLPDSR